MVTQGKLLNPADVGYDIVVCAGQSNNEGRASGYDTAHIDLSDTRIYQYGNTGTYANIISLAVEPLATFTPGGMGPNLRWARSYLHTIPGNRRVLLVPAAKGGVPFEGASTPTGFTWKVGRSDVTNLYTAAVAQTSAAWAAAEMQYPGKNRVVGILFNHGETDGDATTTGATYQTDLDALISQFRTDLAAYTNGAVLPFVIGGMVPEYLSTGTRQAINTVMIDTPRRQARTGFAYGFPGANLGDGNHYNAVGQRGIGDRMWNAFLRARANITGVAPAVPAAPTVTQSGTSALVSWAQVVGRVTDYNVRYSTNGGSSWTALTRTQSIDVTATITGLSLPATVVVEVAAVNEQGVSAWSTSATLSMTAAALANTTAPAVTPTTANVGTLLTTTTGTWSATPDSYTYQWARAGAAISGATAQTYTTVSADLSNAIACTVTAVKSGYTSGTAASNAVTPTAGATTYLSDNFNRADSTSVLGAAQTGGTWNVQNGAMGIASNQAYFVSGSNIVALLNGTVSDGTLNVKVAATPTSTGIRVIFRASNVTSDFWMLQLLSSGKYQLYKFVSGTFTQIGTDSTTTGAANDAVSIVLAGSSITVKVNGSSIFTTTDSALQTNTYFGLGAIANDAAARFDDFALTA